MLSGTAYGFNTPNPAAGAVMRVVEAPELETTRAAGGAWSLMVPANAEATPYVTHDGYVTMHLQTFAVGHEPIERVYFQLVALDIYELLAAVLGISGTLCDRGDPPRQALRRDRRDVRRQPLRECQPTPGAERPLNLWDRRPPCGTPELALATRQGPSG